MGKIFEFTDLNEHFQIEVTSNRNHTFFKSTFISNVEVIENTASSVYALFGKLLREINTFARVSKIHIENYEFDEKDIKSNGLKIVDDKVFVNINGKHKEFSITEIENIELTQFSEDKYLNSMKLLREKVDALYLKLEKKKNGQK